MQNKKVNTITLVVLLSGIAFYCYEFFLRLITGAYAREIIKHFAISTHLSFSFLISSYNFTYLLMQIPAGVLLDRFGSNKTLAFATFLCGIGNIIFILSNYKIALIGRLLVGFGSSFAFIGTLKISKEYFPAKYFGIIASVVISLGTLGAAFSQQVSILFVNQNVSWQIVFLYSGLLALPLSLLFFISFSLEKQSSITRVMPHTKVLYKQIISLLKERKIWFNALWAGLIYVPTAILTAQYGVIFFQSVYNSTTYIALKAITFILMGWVVFSPVITVISNYINKTKSLIVAFIVLAVVTLLWIGLFPRIVGRHLFVYLFFFGCFSSIQVLVWKIFNNFCSSETTAAGIAITNMIITAVIEFGQLSSGVILDLYEVVLNNLVGKSSIRPIQADLIFMSMCMIVAIPLLIKIKRLN